ncbi:hypothetical protein IE53DRAFT_107949 [Violaceomyces palustris]|uniref:Uncharacterized protein n=1 Tax=Violaceomyces palustris TaxID=1673888 RepID=A0ACD0NWP0_9BASI|nr:hypothetical protein IE53DRAFT_107949 [Violaceomyces palustris]
MADESQVAPAHFDDEQEAVPSDEEQGESLMREDGNLVGSGAESGDSSDEEEDDDPEEARRIAEGFIAEDDDEEEDGEEAERRRRRRRKHKKRKQAEEFEDLDEDDLDLVAENTGQTRNRDAHRLKRFRRGSASPGAEDPTTARERELARLFDDDDDEDGPAPRRTAADDDDDDLPSVGQAIRAGVARRGAQRDSGVGYEDDGLDDFIEEDEDEEEMRDLDEEEREARRKEKREEKRRARMSGASADPAKAGIDREAWEDIHEIFGNGDDYAWALDDEGEEIGEAEKKAKMEYKDIFEPAQIAERMLTDEDDRIKRMDIPERLQLAMPGEEGLRLLERKLTDEELNQATQWASTRISQRCKTDFLDEAGKHYRAQAQWLDCVRLMLAYMLNDLLEVPFLYQHRFDELEHIVFNVAKNKYETIDLLSRRELYTLSGLGLKFKTLMVRKESLRNIFDKLDLDRKREKAEGEGSTEESDVADPPMSAQRTLFEDMLSQVSSLEEVSDITEWLTMRYGQKMRDAQAVADALGEDSAADEVGDMGLNGDKGPSISSFKKPSVVGQYERVKNSVISELANNFGLSSTELASNIVGQSRRYFPDDQTVPPLVYAEQFVGGDSGTPNAEAALAKAKMLLSHEIGKDPLMKREVRELFKSSALMSVEPTERGMIKIDDQHPYANFKFLKGKPASQIISQPAQYLQILQAEDDLLVKVNIEPRPEVLSRFETRIYNNYASEGVSDVSKEWNVQRREVVSESVTSHLIPTARLWVKEWLREECREALLRHCESLLSKRVSSGPIQSLGMEKRREDPKIEEDERIPNVLAVSHGMGDPRSDSVVAVFLDSRGRFREHASFDDLRPLSARQLAEREMEAERDRRKTEYADPRGDFVKLLKGRRPDVIVVNGFSPRTAELRSQVRELADIAHHEIVEEERLESQAAQEQAIMDVVTTYDDVARIYQHSARAAEEFPELSELGRYCLALARYAQSPVNEFAALGNDLTAIVLDPHQRLLPQDRLRAHLERAILTTVNSIGVEINAAIKDPYYACLLQYVAGLGPRKAQALVHAITTKLDGTLINREVLIKRDIMTFHVWTNCVAFLRIDQDLLLEADDEDVPDALDSTRIHPEDYDFPRKMAADALNRHEEDLDGEHPSLPCKELMEDDDPNGKLQMLDLDNYAQMLLERRGLRKRATLFSCKDELVRPYVDIRPKHVFPTADEVFTMFTGETNRTLDVGFVLSVVVTRVQDGSRGSEGYLRVRLDSGVEGTINAPDTVDNYIPGEIRLRDLFKNQQTMDAIITKVDKVNCRVEMSVRPWDLSQRSPDQGKTPLDIKFYDYDKAALAAQDAAAKAKMRSQQRSHNRVIDHPNYHNFNYKQAQQYLASQPRGSVVVRPSSKGDDHLAVTWKVDDGVYQNIDVLELDKESEFSLGRVLRIADMGSYSDLDELIVNHVKPMVNMVEMMMNHEKYKGADEEDLHRYLTNWSLANPSRSVYAFGLNRHRPGYFNLSFKANRDAAIQTWPVKVVPNAFKLGQATQLADMAALCNAFKTQYTTQASMARGGKTPGGAGGRTPGGGMTPGGGRTPFGRTPMPGSVTPGANYAGTPMALSTPNPYGPMAGIQTASGGGIYARPPSSVPIPGAAPMPPPGLAPGPPPTFPPPPPPPSHHYHNNHASAGMGGGGIQQSRPPPPPPLPPGMHPDRYAQAQFGGGGNGPW